MATTVVITTDLVLSKNGHRIDLICTENNMVVRPRNIRAFFHLVNLLLVLKNHCDILSIANKVQHRLGINIFFQAGRFKIRLPAIRLQRFLRT